MIDDQAHLAAETLPADAMDLGNGAAEELGAAMATGGDPSVGKQVRARDGEKDEQSPRRARVASLRVTHVSELSTPGLQ